MQRVIALDEEVLQELERTGEIKEKPYCADDQHEEEIGDLWSYEGLHILDNGDHLTIYHPENKEGVQSKVWSGVINLKPYESFTEHASGMWIHADQIGIERDVWAKYFLERYPAVLLPSKKTHE